MDLGYARVSTAKQDLDRQIHALGEVGIPADRIYLDKRSGATVDRPGLRAVLEYARAGDAIVVHTLDRLGRTVRDTLNLIHELTERGVGVRNLADPIRVDSSRPEDPMAQLAVVLLALFAQMERTYTLERAAHARAVAEAKGRRVGRPVTVSADRIRYATHLREQGKTVAEIVAETGIPRTSLYRHLPPRPAESHTASARRDDDELDDRAAGAHRGELLESVTWPAGYRPDCPHCGRATTGLHEKYGRVGRELVVRAVADPCGCGVDEDAAALQAAVSPLGRGAPP